MNKKELIEKINAIPWDEGAIVDTLKINRAGLIKLIEQFDEPQPLRLKDVIARMEGLSDHVRSEWLDDILYKFGSNYGALKYQSGYKQGKLEGEWVGQQLKDADKIRKEINKPTIPQFVADWIEKCKSEKRRLHEALTYTPFGVNGWVSNPDNQETFARAWLDGYTVEEKRYTVKIKAVDQYLVSAKDENFLGFLSSKLRTYFTRKELEEVGFGWVFNCEGIEVEEVE